MTRRGPRSTDTGPLSRNRTAVLLHRLRDLAKDVRRLQMLIAQSDVTEEHLAVDDDTLTSASSSEDTTAQPLPKANKGGRRFATSGTISRVRKIIKL